MSTTTQLIRQVKELQKDVQRLKTQPRTKFKGNQAGDFTTTVLPRHGDYGFQTTDNELQMNCNGVVRAVAMAVL